MSTPAVLVVVAGQAGAGKTRFGKIVGDRTGARVLDMNDMLAGAEPGGMPEPEDYASILAVAGKALEAGQSVVVAGPFHSVESRREVMRVASDAQSALLYIECSANESVRRRRMRDALIAGEKLANLERSLEAALATDAGYECVGGEIPRACQMLIDTTVGISLWAGLAACRVETYVAMGAKAAAAAADEQVLTA